MFMKGRVRGFAFWYFCARFKWHVNWAFRLLHQYLQCVVFVPFKTKDTVTAYSSL